MDKACRPKIIRVYARLCIKFQVFKRLILAMIPNNLKEYVNLKGGVILQKNCHLSAMHME